MAVPGAPVETNPTLPATLDRASGLTSLLHAAERAAIVLDRSKKIEWVSPTIHSVLAYRPTELVGREVLTLVPESNTVDLAAMVDSTDATIDTIPLLNGQLAPIWCDVEVVPVPPTHTILFIRDVSHRVAAAGNVEASASRFRRMIQDIPIGIALQDRDGNFVFLNERLQTLFEVTSNYLLRDDLVFRVHDDDWATLNRAGPDESLACRCRFVNPGGSTLSTRVTIQPEFGTERLRLWTVEDLTTEAKAEEDRARLTGMIADSADLVVLTDREGLATYINPAARRFLGVGIDDPLPTRRFTIGDVISGDLDEVLTALRSRSSWRGDTELTSADGVSTPFSILLNTERDAIGRRAGFSVILRDMTERKQFEHQLEWEATHDPMTQLPNRLLLNRLLDEALIAARDAGSETWVAVAFIDIDRFRSINETLGHQVGDDLLRQTARKISTLITEGDTLSRYAADEFAVLMRGLAGPAEAEERAESIRAAVTGHIGMAEVELRMTLSAGVAASDGRRADASTLTRDANAALHEAKLRGRDCTRSFTSSMRSRAVDRLTLETSLRRALRREEFRVYYQPQVSLRTGHITGMEALVRWQHPENGLTSPAAFVHVAEQTGLIVPLGQWVLEESCRQLVEWTGELDGADRLSLGINLSGRQLQQPTIVEDIRSALERTQVDPDQVELELTESILIDDIERSTIMLERLKDLGVRLALDDFGTGFSSLTYLRSLPIDVVKIDRSFVDGIASDPENCAIVRSIVELASTLGLECIAEGVESEEDPAEIRSLGCDYTQGFLVSPPLSGTDFARLVRYDPEW